MQRQKPGSITRSFGGWCRAAIATELRWLKDAMASGVTVIVMQANIASLVARGVLGTGFDVEGK